MLGEAKGELNELLVGRLNEAGFTVEERRTLTSAESTLGGILLACRQPDAQ